MDPILLNPSLFIGGGGPSNSGPTPHWAQGEDSRGVLRRAVLCCVVLRCAVRIALSGVVFCCSGVVALINLLVEIPMG